MGAQETVEPSCERLAIQLLALRPFDGGPQIFAKQSDEFAVQFKTVLLAFLVLDAGFDKWPEVHLAVMADLDGACREPRNNAMQPFVLAFTGVPADRFQEAMCRKMTGVAEWMQARQVDRLLPYIKIGLIKLLASVFDIDAVQAGHILEREVLAVLALDGREKRRSQKAVRCAALRLWPQR